MIAKRFLLLASTAACAAALAFGFSMNAVAEDLSDNETCLECHADEPRGDQKYPDKPQIHNEDGSFTVEDHEMWSCIDCHDMVTELPHPDGMDGHAVNCENCHEGTPTME
jgi:hypothetical protein